VRVGIIRDGKRIERVVTMRAAQARTLVPVHPSSCRLVSAESTGAQPEDIAVADLPAERATQLPGGRGVVVSAVPAQSAAASAGLRTGDVILRVGKDGIRAARDVVAAMKAFKGEVIPILVRRSGYDFWAALRRK
jgi:C-terminal processing protease CtpA/Prc